ncbi:MAG: thioredoxin domain-containing protein [Hyphomicrobiales bacterium]|nr:thioredoxin domain-containing protein [Hyphomicrobiales bacterium]
MDRSAAPRAMTTRRALLAGIAGAGLAPRLAFGAPADRLQNARDIAEASDPVIGNPAGDVTLVDFFDLQCPACRAMEPRLNRLLAADHGLRIVPIDYPIFGPRSRMGARALLAAQSFGAYEALRAKLLDAYGLLTLSGIKTAAIGLGLDWDHLHRLMTSPAIAARVEANLARGQALGVRRLPFMILGTIRIPGELHYADMLDLLHSARRHQI